MVERETVMIDQLSILIPTFNNPCLELVEELQRQASLVEGFRYEIIVADDGSTDAEVISRNQAINQLAGCRFVEKKCNVGRAAIRNFLAKQAQYSWLLFIDSGMGIADADFLRRYLACQRGPVYGGYRLAGDPVALSGNLRFRYEQSATRHASTASQRAKQPNADFHTSNFLVERSLFLSNPLDERFRKYGYEDVFWGKQLAERGTTILHIDNPVLFNTFESNEQYLRKTEEGLTTLHQFRDELKGYSRLLKAADKLRRCHLAPVFTCLFNTFKKRWKRNLIGSAPSLTVFKLYKLGFYLRLE